MKTNLIIAVLVFIMTFSQQEEPLSNVANIKLPVNSERLSREGSKVIVSREFKYSKHAIDDKKNVYQSKGIIIAFGDSRSGVEPRTLEQLKAEELELIGEMGGEVAKGVIQAKIVQINNLRFYIFKRYIKDEYYYNFTSDWKDGKGVFGTIIFKKDKLVVADKIFDKLLKSISFKKQK